VSPKGLVSTGKRYEFREGDIEGGGGDVILKKLADEKKDLKPGKKRL